MNTVGLLGICPPCARALDELLTSIEQALGLGMIVIIALIILLVLGKLVRFAFAVKVVKPVKAQAPAPVGDVQAQARRSEFAWGSRQKAVGSPGYQAPGRLLTGEKQTPVAVAPVESDWDVAALQEALIKSRARVKNLQVEYDSHGQAMNVVRARGSRR